jgi:ketosteroid isomerase-like protein
MAERMMSRLLVALNAHDLDALVECFAPDYRSEQPAHPSRAFAGRHKVRENWTSVFAGVPDFHAELVVSSAPGGGVEIGEWRWYGTHTDGAPFAMQGVTVMGVEDEHIAWARLYMEVVERDDADIDQLVRETYRPPD